MMKLFFPILLLIAVGCNNADKKDNKSTVDTSTVNKKPVPAKKSEKAEKQERPPIINMTDTLSIKHLVLCLKDSAANKERLTQKLGAIYGMKLQAIIKKSKLKVTGAPMAWYSTQKPPYFFEAGIPVDKKPLKLIGGSFLKNIGTDSVILAHFYGPYELTGQAYEVLSDWIKDHQKEAIGKPYEIYVDDPIEKNGKLKDPYKVQTDIVFPWR